MEIAWDGLGKPEEAWDGLGITWGGLGKAWDGLEIAWDGLGKPAEAWDGLETLGQAWASLEKWVCGSFKHILIGLRWFHEFARISKKH